MAWLKSSLIITFPDQVCVFGKHEQRLKHKVYIRGSGKIVLWSGYSNVFGVLEEEEGYGIKCM